MKQCTLIRGIYGQYFFDGDEMITYIHENDGSWRGEYFDDIAKHYGFEMVVSEANEAQRAQMYDEDQE